MADPDWEQLAADFGTAVAILQANADQWSAWLAGTATGVIVSPAGQPEPGWYPLTDQNGLIHWYPSLAWSAANTAKGEPAAVYIGVSQIGIIGANELWAKLVAAGDGTFEVANSAAVCDPFTGITIVLTVKKNNVNWATVTYTAGSTTGVVAFVTSDHSVVKGDILTFHGPPVFNAAFTSPAITFGEA